MREEDGRRARAAARTPRRAHAARDLQPRADRARLSTAGRRWRTARARRLGDGIEARARLACRRAAQEHRARGAPGGRRRRRRSDRARLAAHAPRARRSRALPRVRAVALGRRPSVPARPRARARAPRPRRSSCNRVSGGTPAASSTRSTSTSRGCVASPPAARGWCTASTARSAPTAASTTAPTSGSPRSTPSSRPRRSSSRGSRLEKHRELGLELRDPVVVPNAVDPAIFHPAGGREPLEGRRVRVIATSWSDNPRKGGETLAWLDRNLDHARYELTFAGRAPMTFEQARRRRPARLERARRAPPHAGRLPRPEPRRSVLERAARGARVRSARRRTATAAATPSSSARAAFRSARTRSSATCSTGSSPSSTSGGRRSRRARSRGSPTATSRSSVCATPPRIPRPWRTTCDEACAALASASAGGSTGRPSREPMTSSTCRTRGPRRRGSAPRRSRTRSTSGSTRRSWSRRGQSSSSRPDVPWRERVLPRVHLRPARGRRGRLDRHRARARRLPDASADHVPRRPLVDGSRRRRRRSASARRGSGRSSSSTRTTRRRTSRPSSPSTRALVPVGVLPDRRGLEHRADPQGPASGPARGDRGLPRRDGRVRDRP